MLLDLLTSLAIIWSTINKPLPLHEKEEFPDSGYLKMFTDYSGHLIASPSLGIYCPSMFGEPSLVCSLAYPWFFMLSEDSLGHVAYSKSTSLESLGFLAPMLVDPTRFIGKYLQCSYILCF